MLERLEDRYKKALQDYKEMYKEDEPLVMDMIIKGRELERSRNQFIHALGKQRFKELGYEM